MPNRQAEPEVGDGQEARTRQADLGVGDGQEAWIRHADPEVGDGGEMPSRQADQEIAALRSAAGHMPALVRCPGRHGWQETRAGAGQ